ncbi:glycosyl hydrolase 115 family protein [Flavobacteriaceae bacterium SZ-1-7]|uniref:glycosyl hydrolase 115 family protein n=1 Tax=Tamlana sedimenti TaxID=3134126 RepID=UPI0031239AA4
MKYWSIILVCAIGIFNRGYSQDSFAIASSKQMPTVVIDPQEAKVVSISAQMFAEDVFKVSNKTLKVESQPNEEHVIILGTIGQSKWVNKLVSSGKIDVSDIEGKWESYQIQIVNKPFEGVDKALVVVGSDRRGAAFGALELSRKIGVSPWEWWADVTPEKQDSISLFFNREVFGEPSVKYRGIFLNDEDWGLQRWAALTYEPDTGDIGPKTYAKIFELLLRLRGNTIWPAMHKSTKAFYSFPKNKQVADDYAIVVGSSHAEPMLSNINVEWNHDTMGEYRYDTNSKTIKNLFEKRAKETANYEGIYTVGMRGEHDSPMIVGEDDTESQVKLLERVITDQREILKENSKEGEIKPQAFVPYKEVLHYYQSGLELPEDITLVWTDDNYGYVRQLSNPKEQKRSGGAGVYYHTSYWGRPHDYLWLNSTNSMLMWEEMSKAFEFQSRNIWILNCGDIKPHEYNIELFLDMAWNISKFQKSKDVIQHRTDWANREFGSKNAERIANLMGHYDDLAFKRRPEFMAWSQVEPVTKAKSTELTQFNYGDEVSQRIKAYQDLIDSVNNIKKEIPDFRKDAFYQLVYYPVIGAASLNHKWLYAYKNQFVALQGRASSSYYAKKMQESFNRIISETNYYNKTLQKGKWNHIMNWSPRYLPVFSQPTFELAQPQSKASLGLALEGYEMELNDKTINSFADVLPVFNAYTKNTYFIDVFLKGEASLNWNAVPKADWIKMSKSSGTLHTSMPEERIWVTLDWDKVPKGKNIKEAPLGHDYQLIPPGFKVNSTIEFISENSVYSVGVSAFNPNLEDLKNFNGFVEDKGFVSINAENFTQKQDGTEAIWASFENLGYTGNVVVALPRDAKSQVLIPEIIKNSPVLTYDFYTFNFGEADVNLQAIPTHAFNNDRGVRCAVAIDDAKPVIVDFQTFGRSGPWMQNVMKNAAVRSVKQIVNKAGMHTLKIWMVDPGVMVDQILIDLGGWKSSYAFPQETKMNRIE